MRLAGALLFAIAVCATACAPSGGGLPKDALDNAVGYAIGDPNTCVLLADRASGKVVYRYGDVSACQRGLPACDRPGTLTAQKAITFAAQPDGRTASCGSNPDNSRAVAWAEGAWKSPSHDLVYSAVMEGERVLPGMEISARLEEAFRKAGI